MTRRTRAISAASAKRRIELRYIRMIFAEIESLALAIYATYRRCSLASGAVYMATSACHALAFENAIPLIVNARRDAAGALICGASASEVLFVMPTKHASRPKCERAGACLWFELSKVKSAVTTLSMNTREMSMPTMMKKPGYLPGTPEIWDFDISTLRWLLRVFAMTRIRCYFDRHFLLHGARHIKNCALPLLHVLYFSVLFELTFTGRLNKMTGFERYFQIRFIPAFGFFPLPLRLPLPLYWPVVAAFWKHDASFPAHYGHSRKSHAYDTLLRAAY